MLLEPLPIDRAQPGVAHQGAQIVSHEVVNALPALEQEACVKPT